MFLVINLLERPKVKSAVAHLKTRNSDRAHQILNIHLIKIKDRVAYFLDNCIQKLKQHRPLAINC